MFGSVELEAYSAVRELVDAENIWLGLDGGVIIDRFLKLGFQVLRMFFVESSYRSLSLFACSTCLICSAPTVGTGSGFCGGDSAAGSNDLWQQIFNFRQGNVCFRDGDVDSFNFPFDGSDAFGSICAEAGHEAIEHAECLRLVFGSGIHCNDGLDCFLGEFKGFIEYYSLFAPLLFAEARVFSPGGVPGDVNGWCGWCEFIHDFPPQLWIHRSDS